MYTRTKRFDQTEITFFPRKNGGHVAYIDTAVLAVGLFLWSGSKDINLAAYGISNLPTIISMFEYIFVISVIPIKIVFLGMYVLESHI